MHENVVELEQAQARLRSAIVEARRAMRGNPRVRLRRHRATRELARAEALSRCAATLMAVGVVLGQSAVALSEEGIVLRRRSATALDHAAEVFAHPEAAREEPELMQRSRQSLQQVMEQSQSMPSHDGLDEILFGALALAIREALAKDDPAVAGYEVNRKIFYAGRLLNYAWQPEWRFRLIRTGWARWSADRVHESLDLTEEHAGAKIGRLAGDLRHDALPSVAEHLRRQIDYAELGAADLMARGRRGTVASLIVSPLNAWLKQMVRRQAWRDGWRGCSAASISACATMMKHLALLEQSRAPQPPDVKEPRDAG